MSSFPRMDRTIVKRSTLDQQGQDAGVPAAIAAERILMVWPLTITAWAFKEPNDVQPRLQGHVVRTIRNESEANIVSDGNNPFPRATSSE